MGGILQVDTIQNNNATTLITQTNSTTLTFGVSGQNIVIPSGVTFNTASATVNLPTTIKVSTIQNTNSTNLITQTNVTTITFGATSQTISVPSVASFNSTIGVGGATPSTSGAGITFPATASGSTDANTLDDYEEGTWTPVITAQSGTLTTTTSSGTYTKIGKAVTVNFRVTITDAGTGTGGLFVSSFPFAATNGNTLSGAAREDVAVGINITGSATGTNEMAFFNGGSTMIASGRGFSCCITYLT